MKNSLSLKSFIAEPYSSLSLTWFRVSVLGFGVLGLGFGVWGLGFRVWV